MGFEVSGVTLWSVVFVYCFPRFALGLSHCEGGLEIRFGVGGLLALRGCARFSSGCLQVRDVVRCFSAGG